MVAFEKRYQGISSDLGFVDFRRLLNFFDIQTKEGFVFGMFQTWNGSLGQRICFGDVSNLEWQFETFW